jgi:ribosome biogenesis protein Nip4
MGKPCVSHTFNCKFYILFTYIITREIKMNLLEDEIKELIKERYYEYLEEGYESFEAMELAKRDVLETKEVEIDAYNKIYDSSIEVD